MKLLYANDEKGRHAPSWYADTCTTIDRPALERNLQCDVCVIGAGFTGLSAALEAAKSGASVVVLDAHRVGWGASGRNGGQLGSGFNQDQPSLRKSLGPDKAAKLWQVCEDAKTLIHSLCSEHRIDIEYTPGIVIAHHRSRSVSDLHAYCDDLARQYDYSQLEPLDREGVRAYVASDDYHGGAIDHGAGHIHPLKLAHGLAHAAEQHGAIIHEKTEAIRITRQPGKDSTQVVTPNGSVTCGQLVLATNGYLDNLHPPINRWVMPINNFIAVTEPLGELASQLLPKNTAVADSRFVVNYFRRVANDRILFGGGENYTYRFPKAIDRTVRPAMAGVFPELSQVGIDYAWGGTLAITRNRLPYAKVLSDGLYTAGGYSGHGVALAVLYGQAIAQHIAGNTERFELLASLPAKPFPGGTAVRPALLAVAMTGYSYLDKF